VIIHEEIVVEGAIITQQPAPIHSVSPTPAGDSVDDAAPVGDTAPSDEIEPDYDAAFAPTDAADLGLGGFGAIDRSPVEKSNLSATVPVIDRSDEAFAETQEAATPAKIQQPRSLATPTKEVAEPSPPQDRRSSRRKRTLAVVVPASEDATSQLTAPIEEETTESKTDNAELAPATVQAAPTATPIAAGEIDATFADFEMFKTSDWKTKAAKPAVAASVPSFRIQPKSELNVIKASSTAKAPIKRATLRFGGDAPAASPFRMSERIDASSSSISFR